MAKPSKHAKETAVISVKQETDVAGEHFALIFTKDGYEKKILKLEEAGGGCTRPSMVKRMMTAISRSLFPQLDIYHISHPNIQQSLLKLEATSPEVRKTTNPSPLFFCNFPFFLRNPPNFELELCTARTARRKSLICSPTV